MTCGARPNAAPCWRLLVLRSRVVQACKDTVRAARGPLPLMSLWRLRVAEMPHDTCQDPACLTTPSPSNLLRHYREHFCLLRLWIIRNLMVTVCSCQTTDQILLAHCIPWLTPGRSVRLL